MGVGRLNVWVSDVADPCGTWPEGGAMTILDCKGILVWPCGRFRTEGTDWKKVPNGRYHNLPFRCGHLEAELPPGCYWVVVGAVYPKKGYIHFNKTTHVGIAQVGCDQSACVKLYNPSLWLCWKWFRTGLHALAEAGDDLVDPEEIRRLENRVERRILRKIPPDPKDEIFEEILADLGRVAE